MKRFLLLFVLLSISIQTQLHARQIDDINVPESIIIGSKNLKLNGAGIREKFFLDLYLVGLYLAKPSSDAETILGSTDTKAIELWVISSLVTSEKMENGVRKGFEKSTSGNTTPIVKEIDAFMNVFKKEMKEGDHFQFASKLEKKVTISKNGALMATIEGATFEKALFGIWLGVNPAQNNLKQEMLGLD